MGMIFKRIALGALVLAAVLLPLRKTSVVGATRPMVDGSLQTDAVRQSWERMNTLHQRLQEAQVGWSAFALRDSAMRIIATADPHAEQPTVALRGFPQGASNPEADSIVRNLWKRVGRTHPAVSTSVLLYNEAMYDERGYFGSLITRVGDRTWCVAIASANVMRNGQTLLRHNQLADAVAPCAMLAAFGPPGPSVGSWLAATRYAAGKANTWLVPEPSRWRAGPWISWRDGSPRSDEPSEMIGFLQSSGALDLALLLQPQYDYGATGLRCIVGSRHDCVEGVLRSAIAFPPTTEIPADLTLNSWASALKPITIGTVRPPAGTLLAAIITDFGRERFEQFWTSNRPFEAAFQDAFGEPLGAWTARWARREWLETFQAQNISADILLGTTLEPSWLLLAAGWTMVALLIAFAVAKRRTA